MQPTESLIIEANQTSKERSSPKASRSLRPALQLEGRNNLAFQPDSTQSAGESLLVGMSQSSGRGPAPLPRNSGASSSNEDDT